MGTELSKTDAGDACNPVKGSTCTLSSQQEMDLILQWRTWMAGAEDLFVQGKFKACREALAKDEPSLPEGTLDAALLRAATRSNASISRLAEISIRTGRGACGPSTNNAGAESYEAVIDGLEDALRETVAIAASAAATAAMTVAAASASVPSSTALPWMPTRNPPDQPVEGDPDASRDCRGGSGGHSTPKCRAAGAARLVPGEEVSSTSKGSARDSPSRRPAVIASAAEDVAIQVACSLLAARLAWGEPSKALATGLHLLASRRNNIAAATLATSGNGIGVDIEGGMLESRSAVGNSDGVRNERGERDGSESLRCEEEAAVTDAFFGVDLLREAFESALRGPSAGDGRRLPLQEAAPRLVHLLRLTWLIATANLALGRASAAARLIAVAEHAYGARRSAWRKATLILASSRPGASGVPPPPAPVTPPSSIHGISSRAEQGVGASGGGGGRDPALAMCRYLRALSSLARGDRDATKEQLEACMELDPRGRHAVVCLALVCLAAQGMTLRSRPRSGAAADSRWKPHERTQELLRALALGSAATHNDGRGEAGVISAVRMGGGVSERGDRGGGRWRAFEEERGGGVEAWLLLACAARAAGDRGGAVSMFRRALAVDANCLEAVYGVARVLQESGDHVSARDLLLYVGERSQELYTASGPGTCSNAEGDIGGDDCRGPFSSAAARSDCPAVGDVGNVGDRGHRRRRRAAAGLCFPLFRGDLVDSCGGGSSSSVARNMVLPAGLAEVMWRVARASMGARDWGTAIMALRGLATDREREGNRSRRFCYYFATFPGKNAPGPSPGPGLARVLRALVYCQLRRGLFREALETTRVVLGEDDSQKESRLAGEDAAMLMFRADALFCLEEEEAVAMRSLEEAARLLNLRQINMSAPFPPPPSRRDRPGAAVARSGGREEAPMQNKPAASSGVAFVLSTYGEGSSTSDATPDSRGAAIAASSLGGEAVSSSASATKTEAPVSTPAAAAMAEAQERHRRIARTVAYNNRAVLLIAGGRCGEACRLLRACLLLLPWEPRPAFNLALALWRMGLPREACAHWLEARGWWKSGQDSGVGGGSGGDAGVQEFTRLLESARRRKAFLESDAESKRAAGSCRGSGAVVTSHVVDGTGDPLSVPPIQLSLLDIKTLSWWIKNLAPDTRGRTPPTTPGGKGVAVSEVAPARGSFRSLLTSR